MEWYRERRGPGRRPRDEPRCKWLDEPAQANPLPDQEDVIPGGEGDSLSVHDVDDAQLGMGIKVEMEHTDDMGKAVEIALDHLAEDPEYYTKLERVHED